MTKGQFDNMDNVREAQSLLLPTGEQLMLLLEALFERSRLLELVQRSRPRGQETGIRQAKIRDLAVMLVQAWEQGPRRPTGSLWGAVDQELTGRLREYLGQDEQSLREMLVKLEAEGGGDRKSAARVLWVLLHENHHQLLAEYAHLLNSGHWDRQKSAVPRANEGLVRSEMLEKIEALGKELKDMLTVQSQQIEKISQRVLTLEQDWQQEVEKYPQQSSAMARRFKSIPESQVRVGVFVDVQNMFYAAKKFNGARLNYDAMLDTIVGKRRLIKAVAYIVESSEIDQSGFISVLEKKGYQVRRKELKSYFDGTAKGDWDMGMAIDMIEMASFLDVVGLVSGDGDFVSLVRLIKKMGPRVELYAFGHNLSTELREISDQFYELGSNLLLKNHHYHPAPADPGAGQEDVKESPAEPGNQEGQQS